jgi:hypothetical protein
MPCYEDWEYEEDGNHDNGGYEYEHESYSDHNEPDQNPSEPDYHNNETDAPWDEGPEYQTGEETYEEIGGTHEHGELEYESGSEAYKYGALEYEPEELEGNEHGIYEHEQLVYDDGDEMRELKELERMIDEEGYEPQGLEYELERELDFEDGEVHQLGELEHEHQEPYELEYELGRNNTDAHYGRYEPQTLESSGVPQRAEPKPKGPGRRTHTHHYHTRTSRNIPSIVHPVSTPPAPIPLERDSPHWNQKGHVTALKSRKSTSNNRDPAPPRTTFVNSIPTPTCTHYAHPHIRNPRPNANKLHEPIELKRMFAKWGREPLEPNYGAYKPNPNKFKPGKLVYNHTRADNEAPPPDFGGGYEELGMDTEPAEPWDFRDTPSKPRYYWNERDLLQSA